MRERRRGRSETTSLRTFHISVHIYYAQGHNMCILGKTHFRRRKTPAGRSNLGLNGPQPSPFGSLILHRKLAPPLL
jgi:hypothetical protein